MSERDPIFKAMLDDARKNNRESLGSVSVPEPYEPDDEPAEPTAEGKSI